MKGPHMQLVEDDKRHFLHPFTAVAEHLEGVPLCIDHAEGIHIYDEAGRPYIDAMAGLWCVNAGYGREEIARAVYEQTRKLSYYHTFMSTTNEPAVRLSKRLADLAPGDLNRVFFCNSGSEANDTHIKTVWYYNNLLGRPGKKKFIARRGAYHGVTVGAASLSGLPHLHNRFDVPRGGFLHVTRPSYYWEAAAGETEDAFVARLAQELEDCILREGPETVAAFIAEPVMGAAGVIVPPHGYFDAIVPVLRKYDVLFIADEVICGFGRLGRMFGSEHYHMQPDLMTVAKGLTSGYVPMAACLLSDRVFEVLRAHSAEAGPFGHGFTYTAHPVSAAAALANLDIIGQEGLVSNAAEVGAHFHARLEERVGAHPLVGEHRGFGLIGAIELVADRERKTAFPLELGVAKRMYRILLEHGLVCRPIMNALTFSPPLILSTTDADTIVDRFADSLGKLADELVREGIWKG